jgi:hypothetical protein
MKMLAKREYSLIETPGWNCEGVSRSLERVRRTAPGKTGVPSVAHNVRLPMSTSTRQNYFFSILFCMLLIFSSVFPLVSAEATSLDDAARQLADRLASIPNFHGPVRLEFLAEAATLSSAGEEWKTTLRDELEKRRVIVTEESSFPALRIVVTQTPTQIVLTASAKIGEREEVRIVATNLGPLTAANLPVTPVRLERQLVYESADRILEASSLWNGEEKGLAILLLRNSELLALRLDASGAVKQTVSLAAASARFPRDPRAEFVPKGTQAEVHLASKTCEFSWNTLGDVKCRAAKPAWREMTLLTSPCDSTDWKLQADGNDWTTADLLQAVPAESAKQGSAAVMSEFPGPILSINGEQNPSNALLVIRNLRTGNYEVYKITLVCGD